MAASMSDTGQPVTIPAHPPANQPALAASASEPDRPWPPRYWWLRRIVLAGLLLLVGLVGLWLWWGAYAERQLDAALDEVRAEGGMLTIEQYEQPPVPDEDNAADLLLQAASLVRTNSQSGLFPGDIAADPTLLVRYPAASEMQLAENKRVLPLIAAARQRSGCDWHIRFSRPLITTSFPALSRPRELARVLVDEAIAAHAAGDELTAIERLQDVWFISRSTQEMPAFLIGHLVSAAIQDLATSAVEWVAVDLRAASDQTELRDRVKYLIANLLNTTDLQQALIRALDAERLSMVDAFTNAPSVVGLSTSGGFPGVGGAPGSVSRWFTRPMIQLDLAWTIGRLNAVVDAAHAESYPDAIENLAGYPAHKTPYARMAHAVSAILLPSHREAFEWHFHLIALRRMAAIALALRLYELDHGHRPASLNALVPDYLPSVPLDPFSASGRTIGYLPDADPPRLYSIGPGGSDEQGMNTENSGGNSAGGDQSDVVFFLTHDHPRETIEPSPQTGNH